MLLTQFQDSHRIKLIKTALCVISFIGLGGATTLLGSALLDLQIRISESFSVTSNLVSARSTGYLVGGVTAGIIEKLAGSNLVLFVTNAIAGSAISLAPWFRSFYLVYTFITISGFAQGIFDIISYTYILRLWKGDKNLSNYVQILHGAFGIGSLLSPLISQPFLLPLNTDVTNDTDAAITSGYTPDDVKVQWAFLSTSTLLAISAGGFLIFFLRERSRQTNLEIAEESETNQVAKWKIYVGVGLMAVLANATFGITVVIGYLAPSFAVKSDLHMDKKEGASLVTVFWVVITVYKVLFIFTTKFVNETKLMIISYCCHFASVFVLIPHASYNRYCVWIGMNLVGIGYAPLFTVVLARLQKYFYLSNAFASFIFINGSIGEAIHPWIASKLMDANPVTYTYYLGAISFANMIACITILKICEKIFKTEKIRENYSRTASIRSWTR